MFVREKKNKSGKISIQIIDKSTGKYKVLKTIGSSFDKQEIENLKKAAYQWMKDSSSLIEIDFMNERQIAENYLASINKINIIGTDLLLGKIFDEIGFNTLNEDLFRQLVFSRICYPVSKLKTTDYLLKYHSLEINVDKIYRYLDKLIRQQKTQIQEISYNHTLHILNNVISVIFYDVSTIYFEIDNEDELRRTGFSKEGKHQNAQIVLGLLVSIDGYPLAYEIFEGNKFEGHTMLPVIDAFKDRFKLDKLVVVADSGLLSGDNIQQLQSKGYEYILGARIKTESYAIKQQILKT